ncbi:MAG: hypothetical protein WB710_09450 [Stellaceae bacterium]
MANALCYGDNLDVLRREIAADTVDLVYLDPPFNSQANYNLLFKGPSGKGADDTPKDLHSAIDLARRDKYQFQWWAVSLVDARPMAARRRAPMAASTASCFFAATGTRPKRR